MRSKAIESALTPIARAIRESTGAGSGPTARASAGLLLAGSLGLSALQVQATEVPFAAGNAIATLASPNAVAVGDLDGDGDLDFVASSSADAVVVWYENLGTGYTAHEIASGVAGAYDVAAVDFDGDGDLDVMVSDDTSADWYENTATGFAFHSIATGLSDVRSAQPADVDGDGDLDVFVAVRTDDVFAWYENQGTAGFSQHVIATGNLPVDAFPADVDGDGDVDLLGAIQTDQTFAWYENTATGWVTHVLSSTANGAFSVHAADVDGDGDLDAITGAFNDNTISWFENQGSLGFTEHVVSSNASFVLNVSAADLDGDGDTDILAALGTGGSRVAWFENDGSQSFTQRTISTSGSTSTINAADMDGDGDLDVLAGSSTPNAVTLYDNETIHGSASFSAEAVSTVSANQPSSVVAADLDGDGDLDGLVQGRITDTVHWVDNQNGTLVRKDVATGINSPTDVLAVDLDGDGDMDVLSVSLVDGELNWHVNNGSEAFTTFVVSTNLGSWPVAVGAVDVDGDGDIDPVTVSRSGQTKLAWFENDNNTLFTERVVDAALAGAVDGVPADLDGDGDVDFVVAQLGSVVWYQNDGSQNFTEIAIATGLTNTSAANAVDLDGDGDLDLVVTSNDATVGGLFFYENDGSQNFSLTTIANLGFSFAAAADLDGDGDLDIAAAGFNANGVYWYENDGSQTFTEHFVATGGASNVAVGDADGDGDLDLFVSFYNESQFAIFYNRGGQFGLDTMDASNTAPLNGSTEAIMRIDASHLGRSGDSAVELVTLDIGFDDGTGNAMSVPLDDTQANNLLANMTVYIDDGDGLFNSSQDSTVVSIDTLTLTAGVQTVTFTDMDPLVAISATGEKTYFVAVTYTADADAQTPNTFRATHLTESTSTAEDAAADIPLRLQFVANTSTAPITPVAPDTVPDAFMFTDVDAATTSTQYESNVITVSGINTAADIGITGGEYQVNGGGYTSAGGTVSNGDTVQVRVTSSANQNETVSAVLDIGGVSDSYDVTTQDVVPDAFSFTDVAAAPASSMQESNVITVGGLTGPASISITGGEYQVNGGGYTSTAGTVNDGDTVQVRVTASATENQTVSAVLDIGGVSDSYDVTTEDITPDAFQFTDAANVEPMAVTESNTITMAGLTGDAAISVTGGEYRIGSGAYTSTAGTVSNGQTVTVRHTSSMAYETATDTVLTVGGVSDTFTSTTRAADATPDAFTFTDATGVEPGATAESNAITVAGVEVSVAISVTGGEYSIDGGDYTSAAGTVASGQSVTVRHTASSSFEAATDTTLTIGGVSDTYTSTTRAVDVVPDAFTFNDVNGVAPATAITSNSISVSGVDAGQDVPISVTGGEYSINGSAFTSSAGTVQDGQGVIVRVTSSGDSQGTASVTLDIGGVTDTFTVTTADTDGDSQTVQAPGGGTTTVTTDAGTIINLTSVNEPAGAPNFNYDWGFYSFSITNIEVGATVSVTVDLPPSANGNRTPNRYVKCDSTGATCAEYDNVTFNGLEVTLTLTDGGAGDADGVANGEIVDPSAPAHKKRGGGGGGAFLGAWLLGLAGLLRRRLKR